MTPPSQPADPSPDTQHKKPWDALLPSISYPDAAPDPVATFQTLSKRGKLPGFERLSDTAFNAAAFGSVYDRTLHATVNPQARSITFSATLNRRTPIIVIIVFILTLFPGVVFTHSLFDLWFSWYRIPFWATCAWYIPLTLLAIPPGLKQFQASERASRQHAEETIAKLATTLKGEVIPAP